MSIESDDITVVFIIRICFNFHANAGPSTGPAPPVVPVDIANSDGESATTSLTLQQRMELAMKASMAQPLDNCKLNDKSMQAAIKSEMAVFERSGVRGRSL